MRSATPILTNFTAGEISDLVAGRVDLSKYGNACRKLENLIPLPQGPATICPGTYHVAEVKDSTKKVRNIPFEFSLVQAYNLEFGNEYIRFYMDGGQIIYETLTLDVGPAPADFVVGDKVTGGTSGAYCYIVSVTSSTVYEVRDRVGTFTDGEILSDESGNSRDCGVGFPTIADSDPVEIASPYLEAHLPELQFVQSFDAMYITHQSYQPRKLTRTAHSVWTLTVHTIAVGTEKFDAENHYPAAVAFFEGRMILAGTITEPQGVWGSEVDVWDDFDYATAATDKDPWKFTLNSRKAQTIRWLYDDDMLLVGTSAAEWRITSTGPIVTYTDYDIKRQSDMGSAKMQALAANDTALFLQRSGKSVREMVYTDERKKYVSPDLTILAPHICGDGLVDWDFQQEPNSILWAVRSDGQLACMTYDRLQDIVAWFRIVTDGEFESISILSCLGEDQIWVSVKRTINDVVKRYIEYFTPRAFTDVADCIYMHSALTFDGGVAVDIVGATQADPVVVTATAHPFENDQIVKIMAVVGMTALNGNYYMVKNKTDDTFELYQADGADGIDGTVFTLTVDTDPAPGDFIIGGTITGATSLETCEVVSKIDSKTYICRNLSGDFTDGEVLSDGTNSVDCAAGYPLVDDVYDAYVSGGTVQRHTKTVGGLGHLEAKTVTILADGATHPDKIVATSSITLDRYANKVHVGLFMPAQLIPTRPELGGLENTTQGKNKRIIHNTLRFYKTIGCKIGSDEDNLEIVPFRKGSDPMDSAPPLFTGDKVGIPFRGGHETDGNMLIMQDQPLPFTLVAVMPEITMET